MSPRPRKLTDTAILEAALKVVSRTGPDRFTLADVGKEVGLSAATLVQRFGSKRSMLLAMLQQSVALTDGRLAAAAVSNAQSPIDALYAAVLDRYRTVEQHEGLANAFAFLMLEVSDPEFHAVAAASAFSAIASYKAMLDRAVEVGELTSESISTQHLAETIHAIALGSLMLWSIVRMLTPQGRIERSLNTLLAPYRTEPTHALSSADDATTTGLEKSSQAPSGT